MPTDDARPAPSAAAPSAAADPADAAGPGAGDGHQVVPLGEADRDQILDLDQWAFGTDDDNLDPEPVLATFEWDRAFGVRGADGTLLGTNLSYSFRLSVPGGDVPCAGLTWVGVHPQARRRGILRAMIRAHLDAVHERGEPVCALYAAEAPIYGRFGYGPATRHQRFTLARGAALRDVPGQDDVRLRLERADADRHADLVADCHEAARATRPGMVSRTSPGLRRHAVHDQPAFRRGGESLRILIADADDGGPARGYALFRRKASWGDGGADGTVVVRECVARDPAAERALWARLLDLDLTTRVEVWDQPLDHPLVHLLVDVRAAVPKLADGLWLRIVDVPAALAGRRYARDVDVVLGVRDGLCPWNDGAWRLTAGPDDAGCEATSAAPDLELDVRELGAAYLGGQTLTALAAAGLVTARTAGAVEQAAAALAWPVAPYNAWMF